MTMVKKWTVGLVLAAGIVGGSISDFAQEEDDLLASTTAQWWQYVNSIPASTNPLLDPSGDYCMVGQRDPMWFLMGTFFGGTVTRTCTVPAGEALFFPVVNSVQINTPGYCGQDKGVSYEVADLRRFAANFIDGVTSKSVTVDGKPVKDLMRIESNVFATTVPAQDDNIWAKACVGITPGLPYVPAGVYSPSVDDGYYVLLKPLSVGNHTLHIQAENPEAPFTLDVTYNLIVAPVQLK